MLCPADSIIASGLTVARSSRTARRACGSDRRHDCYGLQYPGYLDYHSDMTRTVVVGAPSEEQQSLTLFARQMRLALQLIRAPGSDFVTTLRIKVISEAGAAVLWSRPWSQCWR